MTRLAFPCHNCGRPTTNPDRWYMNFTKLSTFQTGTFRTRLCDFCEAAILPKCPRVPRGMLRETRRVFTAMARSRAQGLRWRR